MSYVAKILGMGVFNRSPDHEHWWTGAATQSIAGIPVTADTALKLSTVWACVGLISETVASLPLVVYRMVGEDVKQRAFNNPIYSVVHDRPNGWQTAAEFREMMTGHVLLRGNAYAQIVPGERGAVDQLIPIHPDLVTVEKLKNNRLRYQVRQENGTTRTYNQEDIFHLRGPSQDGVTGLSVIDYARDAFGMSLAAERYGSTFFRNDSRPGGVLRTDGRLSKEAAERLKTTWEAAHTGINQNRVAVLEEGLQWQSIGVTPDQAQFLETREFQAEDVCRWFRVPPHMVGLTSKATSWGSGIEQMSIGFVTYTLMPWLTRWKQCISRDLIIATDTYFADFVVEGLLRGDISSRYQAYATGRQWGWLSVNDIRRLENMNPVEDGDIYLQPLNMIEAGDTPMPEPATPPAEAMGHYRLLAEESAGRVVRKEIAAMTKAAQRAQSKDEFEQAVNDFYDTHADFVAQTMRMDTALANAYTEYNRKQLLNHGVEATNNWLIDRTRVLVNLAIGDNDGLHTHNSDGN